MPQKVSSSTEGHRAEGDIPKGYKGTSVNDVAVTDCSK